MRLKWLIPVLSAGALCGCVKEEPFQPLSEEEKPTAVVEDGNDIVSGWVRLKFIEGAAKLPVGAFTRGAMNSGDPVLDSLAEALGATEVRRVFHEGGKFAERRRRFGLHLWYDVHFDERVPYTRAADGFSALPGVAHVQPVYKARILDDDPAVPAEAIYVPMSLVAARPDEMPFNDPDLPRQWHYNNRGDGKNFVEGADINLFEAWKTETGLRSVIVAINDSGVDFDHPDLVDNMWVNEAELYGEPGVDDDGNGYVDDIYGWNGPLDNGEIHPGAHATHVAGTISAVNNNGIGVCGIAGGTGQRDGVRIMTTPVTDQMYSSEFATNPDNFAYAADNGAVISQNSWAYATLTMPQDVSDALDYFIANAGTDENGNQTGPMRGGIVIFAAGNSSSEGSLFPASDPRTISVAAMNPNYSKANYSNYGDDVDIFAPGGADADDETFETEGLVYSTYIDSTDGSPTYAYQSGTSMACPHVSGVAALIVSHYARKGQILTADECKEILLRSYRPVGEAIGERYYDKLGVGLVDAGLIFTTDSGRQPEPITEASAEAVRYRLTFRWIAPADGNGMAVSYYDITYTGKSVGKRAGQPDIEGAFQWHNEFDPHQEASYVWYGLGNIEYTFEVTAVDRFGHRSQPVTFGTTSGDYVNETPQSVRSLGRVECENVGETYARRFDLSEYFTDENIEEGDVLTYSIQNSDERIVAAEIVDGSELVVTPLARGGSRVTVVAADLDGLTAQSTLYVTVADGPAPEALPSGVYPNPADDMLFVSLDGMTGLSAEAVVYDQAAREVMTQRMTFDANGTGQLIVANLKAGSYMLVVRQNGAMRYRAAFIKR